MNGNSAQLVRALCGPVMLMTLGALFAIDYMGAQSFSRTWPVLVIVKGLCLLLERMAAPRPGQTPVEGGNGDA